MQGTREFVTDAAYGRERSSLRTEVLDEVCHHLAPFQVDERPITEATIIYKELSIDSLAVMDIILEVEDRFGVAIPINTVAEIHTVQELVDAILRLRARG